MSVKPLQVWLVDDDSSIRWVLEKALKGSGMTAKCFDQADNVLTALRGAAPDVLMTDIRMPGRSGLDLLKEIQISRPGLPVIVMTAHSDLDAAVAAYQGGAFEYLPKPFDIDKAVDLVRRADFDWRAPWLASYGLEYYLYAKVLRDRRLRWLERPVTMRYPAAGRYSKIRPGRDWWAMLRPWLRARLDGRGFRP